MGCVGVCKFEYDFFVGFEFENIFVVVIIVVRVGVK